MLTFREITKNIQRCSVGHGNYVFIVEFEKVKQVIRLNENMDAYKVTAYWLSKLRKLDIPVPEMIDEGNYKGYAYIILEYIKGNELAEVYEKLEECEKKKIAKQLVDIQRKVASLPENNKFGSVDRYHDDTGTNTWKEYLTQNLERSKKRIAENEFFECQKVDAILNLLDNYNEYFENIKPKAFLDDISNKNLLIRNGEIAGIIDIDWMGFGDELFYVALTNMALLDMNVDTKYVDYILEEMNATNKQKEILILYTLLFCVDFMGEKGAKFQDKIIPIDTEIQLKLNNIYEILYDKLKEQKRRKT